MFEINTFVYILCNIILKMLIKLVVKIYSLNLVSAYQRYTLIVFMTQRYLTAKRLRITGLERQLRHFVFITNFPVVNKKYGESLFSLLGKSHQRI